MSLIAHFPLNGNGINKGISNNFDIEDSNFDIRGKIGKYLKIANKRFSTTIPELVGKKQVSISFWFKEMAEAVTQWQDFICLWSHFDDGEKVTDGEVRLESFRHSSNDADAVQWYSTVFNKNYPTYTDATCFWEKHMFTDNDVWYHNILLVDFENHTWTWYINGEKRSQYGINENALYFMETVRLGDYSLQAGLNDVRIYDHILSDAEIKEIYKTPILKYSFDQPIMNPVISRQWNEDFSSLFTGASNKCAAIGTVVYNNNYVIEGDWVTISFDVEIQDLVTVEGQIGKVRVQEVTTLADGTEKWSTLIRDDEELNDKYQTFISSDGTREINLTNNGKYHIVRSYHFYDTARFINNWTVQLRADYIQSGTLKVTNFKTVLGKNEISYDGTDGVVYDDSGMGNDATFYGEDSFLVTSYSTDSKIGEGCWESKIQTNLGESTYGILECSTFSEVPELSISFWLYVPKTDETIPTDGQVIIGYSPSSNNYGLFIRRWDTAIGATIYHTYLGGGIFTRGKWNHIVITAQKVGSIKIYVDGKLMSTGTIPSGVDWANAKLTIGDLRRGRNLSFKGKLDDLVIYATILSEEDIAQMYKERQKVDNNGNLYCKEMCEIDNDNNIFDCNNPTAAIHIANLTEYIYDIDEIFMETKETTSARYFRYQITLPIGTYRASRTYQIYEGNATNYTGNVDFRTEKDGITEAMLLRLRDSENISEGSFILNEETTVFIYILAAELNEISDVIKMSVKINLFRENEYPDLDTKFLGNGIVNSNSFSEQKNSAVKIYNEKKMVQAQQIYEN